MTQAAYFNIPCKMDTELIWSDPLHTPHFQQLTARLLECFFRHGVLDDVPEEDIPLIAKLACLHDMGKLWLSDEIVYKPGRLSPEENSAMKRHTTLGAAMVEELYKDKEKTREYYYLYHICRHHHERWDGDGYAAATYRAGSAQFKTYAVTVIRNHLLEHCRSITAQLKNAPCISLDTPMSQDLPPPADTLMASGDEAEDCISQVYISQILEHGKRTYSGVAKLGIEAMELKVMGYGVTDIAALYQTRPNHVGAWISRAAEKLRNDAMAAELLDIGVEKGTSNP